MLSWTGEHPIQHEQCRPFWQRVRRAAQAFAPAVAGCIADCAVAERLGFS